MINILIITIIFTVFDQLIKLIITNYFSLGESLEIIKNFFYLTNVHNYGAAWSILTNQVFLLIMIAIVALVIIYSSFIKNKNLTKSDTLLLGMLISGILGNLIDRIVYGYVIDYLDFYIFNYNFPIFNLADTLIVISAILLFIKSLKEEKNGKIHRSWNWRKYTYW